MSYSDDRYEDRHGHRDRGDRDHRRDPVYEQEEIIAARRVPKGSKKDKGALIPKRRDSSESSIEEIPRGHIPVGGSYHRRHDDYSSKRPRSAPRKSGGRYDDYDDYDRPRRSKRDKRHNYSSSSSSPSPRRDRRKSMGEQALGALGLGGAAAAALAGGGRSKSQDRGHRSSRRDGRSRRHSSTSSSSRSRSRGRSKRDVDPREKMIQAAKAAVLAGGTEAWRMRKEPGGWGGPKGRRVLTAAIGAAGVNGLVGKDNGKGDTGGTIQSVIGGLAGNRLINGSRNDERSRSRSRGRGDRDKSDSKGGALASLGGAAALATAAAKAFQGSRSKSRDRGRNRRDYDSSSDDGRYGGRHGGKRSKSVSDKIRQGMGVLGIGGNRDQRDITDRDPRHGPEHDSEVDDDPSQSRFFSMDTHYGGSSSSDDDMSSSEEDRERKKMGRKQLITAGLASVATVHAAHHVYNSIHLRQVHAREVRKGEMSPQEAEKLKKKTRVRSAAAIGVAALGVKGAYSGWKEMKEQRDEALEFDRRRRDRHERRLMRTTAHDERLHPEPPHSAHPGYTTPGQGYQRQPPFSAPPYAVAPNEYRSSAPNLSSDPNAYYSHQAPASPQYPNDHPYDQGGYIPPSAGPPTPHT